MKMTIKNLLIKLDRLLANLLLTPTNEQEHIWASKKQQQAWRQKRKIGE